MKTQSNLVTTIDIILRFLKTPSDHTAQLAFVELCLRESERFIKSCFASGGASRSMDISAFDLANDFMGSFLAPRDGTPCHTAIESLTRRFGDDIDSEEPETVEAYFRGMIAGVCRQEYAKCATREFPEVAKLRKAFNSALKAEGVESDGHGFIVVGPADGDSEIIDFDSLLAIVRQTFADSTSRPKWVRRILSTIAEDSDLPKRIRHKDLIAAAVAVNSEFASIDSKYTGLSDAECLTVQRTAWKAMDACLDSVGKLSIERYVEKERISTEDARRVTDALEAIVIDFTFDGSHSSFPSYMRDLDPSFSQEHYQSHFKFVIDTVAQSTIECICDKLRNDPTIRGIGFYFL